MCKTEAIADIVMLVDGSWSIGRANFKLVRMFLASLVKAFDVDFDRTRIGEMFCKSSFTGVHTKMLKFRRMCKSVTVTM